MLLSGYNSDSGSDSDGGSTSVAQKVSPPKAAPKPATTSTTAVAPPVNKGKKRTGPLKITLDLPKTKGSKGSGSGSGSDGESAENASGEENDGDGEDGRTVKKPKFGIKGGKGSSSLLGMLPAPKRKLPASASAAAKPSLGSGDMDGKAKKSSLSVNRSMAARAPAPASASASVPVSSLSAKPSTDPGAVGALGDDDVEEEDGGDLDLFGLGTSSSSKATSKPSLSGSSGSAGTNPIVPPPTSISITSAPSVSAFVPPDPTPQDAYPGYYQLLSGQWAAYDPEFYHSFFASAADKEKDEAEDDGRRGHGWAALNDSMTNMVDVRADTGMAEARAEEERKALAKRPKMLGDDYKYEPIGQIKGAAADKHQLSSLLNNAFSQREALEERIAQNKKSSRTARTKYGF